jgi:hypothetical protein
MEHSEGLLGDPHETAQSAITVECSPHASPLGGAANRRVDQIEDL